MANFDNLFCINDSFWRRGRKLGFLFGNEVVGPKRNNHHGSEKRSSTYVDAANCHEVGFFPGQIPSLWRRWHY